MKITLMELRISVIDTDTVSIKLSVEGQEMFFEAVLSGNHGINAITYPDDLVSILCRNAGEAKKLHHLIWDLKSGKPVTLPSYLGDF